MSTPPFTIQVGMSSADYNQRNRSYVKKVDEQPAGLNFYEQNWGVQEQGTVNVEHGDQSITIPYVLSSTGTENIAHPERGIYSFSINSGISSDEFIDHDQARRLFVQMLQQLVSSGWQPYIEFYTDPRLSGQESFQYAIDDGIYAPDPLYTPTLEEWMQLGSSHRWVFYANNVFLTLVLRRNQQFMEKDSKGVYLINYKILTAEAHAQNQFEEEDREQWKNLWVDSIKEQKMERYRKEVELIKQGYHINTQYSEPKIHPDDPVEPEKAKELLDFIQKNNP